MKAPLVGRTQYKFQRPRDMSKTMKDDFPFKRGQHYVTPYSEDKAWGNPAPRFDWVEY